jgi:hypothetical protein
MHSQARLLRGDLDAIVSKAMRKDPGERYNSAAALADDLRRFLRNEPIRARPETVVYRARKLLRRNRTAVALSAFVFLATLCGLLGTLIQAHRASLQRDFAMRRRSGPPL